MKKTSRAKPVTRSSARGSGRGLAREYSVDSRKSRPNRFAKQLGKDTVVIVLDADVAAEFQDSRRVNAVLRASLSSASKSKPRRAS